MLTACEVIPIFLESTVAVSPTMNYGCKQFWQPFFNRTSVLTAALTQRPHPQHHCYIYVIPLIFSIFNTHYARIMLASATTSDDRALAGNGLLYASGVTNLPMRARRYRNAVALPPTIEARWKLYQDRGIYNYFFFLLVT
jgi:hypothetical protein